MVAIKPIQPAAGPTGHAELVAEPLKPVSGPAATERALEKPHLCTADPGAVAAIVGAYHSTPFDILGIHPHAVDGKPAIVIRTFQPQAFAVSVVHGDQAYPMHRVHRDGFFEVVIQNQTEFFPYRLAITTFASDGGPQQTYEIEDPYRYPPILTDFDLHLIGEGSHYRLYEKLGARVIEHAGAKGVSFSVWAPNAERVSVVGNFNQWDGRCHPMRPRGASGVWEIFVPGLQQGDLYKFEVKSRYHGYLAVKSDPFAHLSEMRPNTSSVVWDLNRYEWHDQEWMATRKQRQRLDAPIAIYEVHPGSWKRKDDAIGMRWLSYREMAEDLVPYVREMGYTHIELLPITEHPFDGSWGYQSIGYFASTSRYGSPDDFRYFVDKAHQAGLGVILDWAGGHFPKDGYGLSYFDGTCLYEHEDPRKGEHQDWGTLIYNFGRNEVRAFLLSSVVFWLDKYHIDGLRVDAVASMLYLDYSRQPGEWIANEFGGHENLEAVAFIKQFNEVIHLEYPDVLTFAEESTAWPQVSRPTYLGGLGFDLKWNMGWMHDMLEYMSKDPIHRRYHHNNLTFSLLYAFTENFVLPFSHDEVTHGKGAMLSKMPGDYWQKFANLRALYGYMYAHPGKKLLFMGGEIGQWSEWNHDWQLDWSLLDHDLHRKIQEYLRALNKLYVEQPALHEVDFSWEGFQWIDFHDVDNGVVSFVRRAKEPNDFVLAVANFTPVPREGYRVGVPAPGFYRELLNSDSTYYGGSNMGNTGGVPSEPLPWQGQQHSILLTVPPLAVVFLKPDKEAPSSEMSNAATTPIRANRNNAQHQEHPAETLKLNDEQGNSDE